MTSKRLLAAALIVLSVGAFLASSALAGTQITIRIADGAVLQAGDSAGPLAGATNCLLDSTSVANLATAVAGPHGGLGTVATPDTNGNCNGATFVRTPTPTPVANASTLAAGANAGSSPPAPSFVAGAGSTVQRGLFQFGTGTLPAAGAMVTVTYPQTYAVVPAVFLQPFNAATAALCPCYTTGDSTTGTTIVVANAPAASQVGTTYRLKYLVVP